MGSGSKKRTETYRPDRYITDASRLATQRATQFASRPYQAYQGERVAPLSGAEQQGLEMAQRQAGTYQPYIDRAGGALEGVSTDFRDFDYEGYMNPYIKGALDPAARELREEGMRRQQEMAGQMSSRGAFGGSRAMLALNEAQRGTDEAISDLYGRGYAQAFESGADRWAADQKRMMDLSRSYLDVAGTGVDIDTQAIDNLMRTGEVERTIDQLGKDFDYMQFVEGRDWDAKQAGLLADILPKLQGTYGTTRQTKDKSKGNVMGQILGAATTLGGLAMSFTGATTPLAAMGAIWSGMRGTPDIGSERRAAMDAGVS